MNRTMRMRILMSFFLVIAAFSIAFSSARDQQSAGDKSAKTEKKAVTNHYCPITGEDVNPNVHVEYKGQYVYFCCSGCIDKFKADPESYISKMSKEEQEAIKPNDKCPVTGEPVNKSISSDYQGRKVYFCCKSCQTKFIKSHSST